MIYKYKERPECSGESPLSSKIPLEQDNNMKSTTKILAFVGGTPAGRAPPDLTTVPVSTDSNFTFVFVLAFARDQNHDGNFSPAWHPSITPSLIASLQQSNPNRRFIASLGGGDNWPWQDPSNINTWVNNAVTSLTNMKNLYHLDGFDLDYEDNLDTTFLPVMEQVIQAMNDSPNFPPRFQTAFSVTPFGKTYDMYQQMFVDESSWIPAFNYQAYADGLTDVQAYLDKYASLASKNPNRESNGYQEISLGICSTTSNPRGLQVPDIYTVWNNLHSQGAINVVIWCLEDSALTNYTIETTIQAMS